MRVDTEQLVAGFRTVLGKRHVLTGDRPTRFYRNGFRAGTGACLAVLRPGSLVEQWRVLKLCVEAGVIVIAQASNTGLTGGSTPHGDYDRPVVIISTTRLKKIYLVYQGRQVVCLPGATLDQLEQLLRPLGREPHSVIGSTCIGASVVGGICNNSGGALVRRGPAYTQMSMFARLDERGRLVLVNNLGIGLGKEPERILHRLDCGKFSDVDVVVDAGAGHDHGYVKHVREIDAPTPARFNADASRLYESSGSAGKVMVFAVRVDTFPLESGSKVFYLGTNNADELMTIRRDLLSKLEHLPISGEYMHRHAFDIAEAYGKDTFLAIRILGPSRLPALFAIKARCDALLQRLPLMPKNLADRVMQASSKLFPSHLPARMKDFRRLFEHHLILKVSSAGTLEMRNYLRAFFATATGDYFECAPEEGAKAFLHRFAAAGAAVRYRALHTRTVEDIVALDIALPRNERHWMEHLPSEIDAAILHKLYYGHFLCHVFHQDYIVKKGTDCVALEHRLWQLLDARGAEYPAEHNVGHMYIAKPALRDHYRALDPCNCFNPGLGQTSKARNYQ